MVAQEDPALRPRAAQTPSLRWLLWLRAQHMSRVLACKANTHFFSIFYGQSKPREQVKCSITAHCAPLTHCTNWSSSNTPTPAMDTWHFINQLARNVFLCFLKIRSLQSKNVIGTISRAVRAVCELLGTQDHQQGLYRKSYLHP